jgi:hypothetical protein
MTAMTETSNLVAAEFEARLLAAGSRQPASNIQHRVIEHVHCRDLMQHQLTRPDGADNDTEQVGNN